MRCRRRERPAPTTPTSWPAGICCPTGLTGGTDSTGLDPVTAVNDPNAARSTDSAACLLFHTFLRKLLNATFADDAAIPGVDPSGQEAIRAFLFLVSLEEAELQGA